MNKKLQKGLTTAMAAAMGAGMVVPTVVAVAAPVSTGWVKAGTSWNYLKSGVKATGWVKDGASWYFLDANGAMKTGWAKDGSSWYFLNASGAMQTGWVKDGSSWYFLNASGTMQTGWVTVSGTWYYLFNSGSMAVNTTVDGWKLDASGAGTKAAVDPIVPVVPPVGKLAVASLTAASATGFKAVFNQAVTDTTSVAFTILRGTTTVAATTTWNAAKTEATVSASANLPEGSYTVNVKNAATDLGTSNVTISQQKIAKIAITSTKLGVTTDNKGKQTGFATYTIVDQYGNDITAGALANNVQFQSGVGSVTASKGLLTINPADGLNLMTFTTGIVVTANETSSGATTTATLTATSQVGTLSDIKLTTLTNADNKVLTAGDTSTIFYAAFTATDISGNPTTNYKLIQQGLIYQGTAGTQFLSTSSPYITAELKQDPADSNKAVIEVRANDKTVSIDTDAVITAMTWTGKTSQITAKVKRQAEVNRFVLLTPSEDIASNESKEIPFAATDQNGLALTKYEDLSGITFTNVIKSKNVDGTLCLKNTPVENTGTSSITQVISASVPNSTNGYSSITINIQKPAVADTLCLDSTILNTIMQSANGTDSVAEQTVDFGWDNAGLSIKDQFGRLVDMDDATDVVGKKYKVVPSTSDASVVAVSGFATSGQTNIGVVAGKVGSATVTFKLIDMTTGAEIDTKSQTFTVLKNSDIKGYTMDTLTDAMYVDYVNGSGEPNKRQIDYDFEPAVYGKTSTGAKVVLRGTPIIGASISNSDFAVFAYDADGKVTTKPVAPDCIAVVASKLADQAKTGSAAILSVTLLGYDTDDNKNPTVYTVTTPLKSSTVDPVAAKFSVSYKTYIAGVTHDGDTITVDRDANQTDIGLITGNYMTRCGRGNDTRASIYFKVVDQYGSRTMPLSQIVTVNNVSDADATKTTGFAVDSDGRIASAATTNGYVTLTGVTTNGLVKTVKIVFTKSGIVAVDKTALKAAIVTANALPMTVGTAVGSYTQVSVDTFKAAIATAQAVVDNAKAVQTDVVAAVTALATATKTFTDSAIKAPAGQTTTVTAVYNADLFVTKVEIVLDGVLPADFAKYTVTYNGTVVTRNVNNLLVVMADGNVTPATAKGLVTVVAK